MPRTRYEQEAVLPDGRPITLRWQLTLERYDVTQGGPGWGVSDADLVGFHLNRRYFDLGEHAAPLIVEQGGQAWLDAREAEVTELDSLELEELLGSDYCAPDSEEWP